MAQTITPGSAVDVHLFPIPGHATTTTRWPLDVVDCDAVAISGRILTEPADSSILVIPWSSIRYVVVTKDGR